MSNRAYFTTAGRPACGNGCRWPRGECPTHRAPQTAKAAQILNEVEAYLPSLALQHTRHRGLVGAVLGDDATCGGCGYHVCSCPKAVVRITKPDGARKGGPFAVGELVRRTVDNSEFAHTRMYAGAVHVVAPDEAWDEPSSFRLRGVSGEWTYSYFTRVAADELPPGWVLSSMDPRVERYVHGRAVVHNAPAMKYKGQYAADWAAYVPNQHSDPAGFRNTMHEAMRLARGLARVEQLWDVTAVTSDDGGH